MNVIQQNFASKSLHGKFEKTNMTVDITLVTGKAYSRTGSMFPVGIYMFTVSNRNTRARCEIRSKLTVKTPERCQVSLWCLYC